MAQRLRAHEGRLFDPTLMDGTAEPRERRVPSLPNDGADVDSRTRSGRNWPRCELGFTHYELGATSESSPTIVWRNVTRRTPA